MAESSGIQAASQSSGNPNSAAANRRDKEAATFSEAVRAAQARYTATSSNRDWVDNVFDVLDIVGGTAEALAGSAIATGGVAATAGTGGGGAFVGVPLTLGGAAMVVHGLDTAETAFGRLITGFDLDTDTSQALQAAGMSREAANLTDAGIGLVFSGGAAAISKYPNAATRAAGLMRDAAQAVPLTAPDGKIAVALHRRANHMMVGVQAPGDEGKLWSELLNPRPGTPNNIVFTREPSPNKYNITELPISAEDAERALARMEELVRTKALNGTPNYRFGQSDCIEYVADILNHAGVETPLSDEAAELLGELRRQAEPLIDASNSARARAATEANGSLAGDLASQAEDMLGEALSHTAPYVHNRTSAVFNTVSDRAKQLSDALAANGRAFDEAARNHDAASLLADTWRAGNSGISDRTGRQAAVAGGAYLADAFEDLFPEGNARAASLAGQSPALDRSPVRADWNGTPTSAADDQPGLAGRDYFDLFGSPLDGVEYDPPVAPDTAADPVSTPASPSEPQDSGSTPTGWPVGLAEPSGPAAPAQEPVPPSSPAPETAPPTQPAPDAGRPAAPGPQQPTGGDTADEGEPFFGDIIKMSENEMREWTPADGGPKTGAPDDEDADSGGAEPAAGSGSSEMPNPEGDPAPGTGPSYPVYRANGAGAIRPAEEPADLGGGFVNIGAVYNRTNGPGTIRPTDGGPVYDIDVDISSLDLNAIYGRSNGAGAIRPNELADPPPSGGTLPIGPGGDPTVMAETLALGRLGLG
jgi:hypothetical protein